MNQLSTLLLVDPDPRGLETLTYGFEREGCTVAGTSDPGLAADLVRTTSPQLAVVSLRGPERTGLDLIAGLRRGPAGGVPVMTLGPADLKTAAMAAGSTDFLPMPLFVRDVVSVGKLLTLTGQFPRPAISDGNEIEIEIEIQARLSEYYGLFYLLRAMAVTGRSGILLMNRGNRKAEVRFCEGTVMAAHVAALQGLPAIHQLLLWDEAALSLKFRAVPKRTQLHLSAQELLDECERFLRDFAFGARDLGAPQTVYSPAPDRDARASGLQPSQVGPVLRLFDGHRALAEVLEDSPFRVFDTVRVIKRLIDAGAIVARPPAANDGARPRSMLEQWAVAPDDQRGVVGDRRKSSRRIKPVAVAVSPGVVKPLAASPIVMAPTGAAPIPLTVKKGAAAAGEFAARRQLRTPPPSTTSIADAPTVQVRVDATGMPIAAPMVPAHAAPLTAQQTPPPRMVPREPARSRTPAPFALPDPAALLRTPPPLALDQPPPQQPVELPPMAATSAARDSKARLKKISGGMRLTPSTAFDAVEADFFAREADLYKSEAVESFDDLDRGGPDGRLRPGGLLPKK